MLIAFGIGLALSGAPGPVQAILLSESIRGGIGRGLATLAGVVATFGLLLALTALGLSVAPPEGPAVRVLRAAGGVLLVILAIDGIRSGGRTPVEPTARRGLPVAARGSLAILLNPGAWIFLGSVASPLLASVSLAGGTMVALAAAAALLAGAGLGDATIVVIGATGLRRANPRAGRMIRGGLAVILGFFGVSLVASAILG